MFFEARKILLFICSACTLNLSAQNSVGLIQNNSASLNDGYVLFAPINSNTTYLIDKCGRQVKTWLSDYRPGQSCYLLPDGNLLRSGNANNSTFNAGGKGGVIQKIDWTGTLIWSYTVSGTAECQHHDIKALPNGNVLAIVWESKSNAQAIAAGRNPSLTTATVWSEKIIEIQPIGSSGGNVVWEWHLWDHLVQDFDNSKSNYGIISSSPQLINLNFAASSNTAIGQDWIHLNSIDYNPSLDQILLSSHGFDEVWIIDHSTTTAEAASHASGNSGKGGDILYRWGNPGAYNNGSSSDQKLFGQHNAYWIEPGLPYQNEIMIFNNGNGRTGGNYSTVEIIKPPVSGSTYSNTLPYLPASTSWIYNAGNTKSFYAQNISGSQQLSNGNVLYCDGPSGKFKEVNTTGAVVWEYVNPVNATGVITQGATPAQNLVFRCGFYPSSYIGFNGKTLTPGNTIENTNSVSTTCALTMNNSAYLDNYKASVFPNPADESLNLYFNDFGIKSIELFNSGGQKVYLNTTDSNQLLIKRADLTAGIYLIKISDQNGTHLLRVVFL